MGNNLFDHLILALPSLIGAVLVIMIVERRRKLSLFREQERLDKIVNAEIQFNNVYANIYIRRNIYAAYNYTDFVRHADKDYIRDHIDLDRYWELVERCIGKTEKELRDELKHSS